MYEHIDDNRAASSEMCRVLNSGARRSWPFHCPSRADRGGSTDRQSHCAGEALRRVVSRVVSRRRRSGSTWASRLTGCRRFAAESPRRQTSGTGSATRRTSSPGQAVRHQV